MNPARRILLVGGIALAILGMCHGIWYAVFAEHQALDRIGGSLASAFTHAADRDPAAQLLVDEQENGQPAVYPIFLGIRPGALCALHSLV